MISPYQKSDPKFTLPLRPLLFILFILGVVGAGGYVLFPKLEVVFLANIYINGGIAMFFFVGIAACFGQVYQLFRSIYWISDFAAERSGQDHIKAPQLLRSMAELLRARGARHNITPTSARSILDSVATRIDEMRDITRYFINLLIFLGLLGTFYGLATTIPAIVQTVQALNPSVGEDSITIFARLISGIEVQLGGMGTAFASSLLGLAGSLIVGLIELFVNHGQNRFYREFEDWLSTITRLNLSSAIDGGEERVQGEQGGAGYADQRGIVFAIRQLVDQMEIMRQVISESEQARLRTDRYIDKLAELVVKQTSYSANISEVIEQQTHALDGLQKTITALAELQKEDPYIQGSLRMVEMKLAQITEEIPVGFDEVARVLRSEIVQLGREIKAEQSGSNKRQ